MPELPEVECLVKAIAPLTIGKTLSRIVFTRTDLREKVPARRFKGLLGHQRILAVTRRSKYICLHTATGIGILHLGMTGNILCKKSAEPEEKHTHAVFGFSLDGAEAVFLHFVDPRRFGFISCFLPEEWAENRYFHHLGPEPLTHADLGSHLHQASRGKKVAIKTFIMNAQYIVGVGNIYASEALFRAKISPLRAAGELSMKACRSLATSIQETLSAAIEAGGSSIRDYRSTEGTKGYFQMAHKVYGREGEACSKCRTPIEGVRLGNRSTFFCPACQL